jgi:hypothetical protein
MEDFTAWPKMAAVVNGEAHTVWAKNDPQGRIIVAHRRGDESNPVTVERFDFVYDAQIWASRMGCNLAQGIFVRMTLTGI